MKCIYFNNNPIMHYTHNTKQVSLFNFTTMGFDLEDCELYKISRKVCWEEVISQMQTAYSTNNGRHSNSIRVMTGLEMAKTFYGISDELVVEKLKTDVGVMVLCGFDSAPLESEIPSSQSLSDFRCRLSKEIMDEINAQVIRQEISKLPPRKRTQVASDSTCMEANIKYPTDAGLLSKVADKLINVAENVRKNGKDFLIRGKHKIRKIILEYNKKRKKTKTEIEVFARKLIKYSNKIDTKLRSKINGMTKTQKEILQKAEAILEQCQVPNSLHTNSLNCNGAILMAV